MAKKAEVERGWHLVDATDKPLGRLASRVAYLLQGKHKTIYTPHVDAGDFVVVVNAERVKLTGKKAVSKIFYMHSGYPGGLRAIPYGKMLQTRPEKVMMKAVKDMLPDGSLGKRMLTKLKVYKGSEHPHASQKPKAFSF